MAGRSGQVDSGLRRLLSWPGIYNSFQNMVGAPRALERFMLEFVQPQSGDRILDMGCGAGQLAAHLPDEVGYVGLDISAKYITNAKIRHPEHVFHCATIGTDDLSELNLGYFDHVTAVGVLHHLDDDAAIELFAFAQSVLRPDGTVVSVDPTHFSGQSVLSRWVIGLDRGQSVRTRQGYAELVPASLNIERLDLVHGLLNIPYSHCVLRARRTA